MGHLTNKLNSLKRAYLTQCDKMGGKSKKTRCGVCNECLNPECGDCKPGKYKPKNGGSGKNRQPGVRRRCKNKTVKNKKPESQPSINSVFTNEQFIILAEENKKAKRRNKENDHVRHSRYLRRSRCGSCSKCKDVVDCGECSACKDMPKFGGQGRVKQACFERRCGHLDIKYMSDKKQPKIKDFVGGRASEYFELDVKVLVKTKIEMEHEDTKELIKVEPDIHMNIKTEEL